MFVQLPEDTLQKNAWPSSSDIGPSSSYRTNQSGTKLNTGLIAYLSASYSLTLRNSAGGEMPLVGVAAPLKRTTPGKAALIYRRDKSGKHAAESGEYLWMRSQIFGASFGSPTLVSPNLRTQQGAVLLERDDKKVDVVHVSPILKVAALAGKEKNPIDFTIRVGNYSSDAEKLVENVVGGEGS